MPLARIRYPVRVLGHRVAVQCGRRARTPTRLLHSPAPRPDLASRINGAFSAYPRDSIACVLATEIASIYGSYQLLRWLDVDVPADFAVAFALARPLRRFRLPVELAGAVALSKAFPILPKIQVSRLSGALPSMLTRRKMASKIAASPTAGRLKSVVDRYGAAYFVSARLAGVGVVLSMYTALRTGLDAPNIMEWLGVEGIGSVLGQWAAAVTLSSSVYPFTIVLAALGAARVGPARQRLLRSLRRP